MGMVTVINTFGDDPDLVDDFKDAFRQDVGRMLKMQVIALP